MFCHLPEDVAGDKEVSLSTNVRLVSPSQCLKTVLISIPFLPFLWHSFASAKSPKSMKDSIQVCTQQARALKTLLSQYPMGSIKKSEGLKDTRSRDGLQKALLDYQYISLDGVMGYLTRSKVDDSSSAVKFLEGLRRFKRGHTNGCSAKATSSLWRILAEGLYDGGEWEPNETRSQEIEKIRKLYLNHYPKQLNIAISVNDLHELELQKKFVLDLAFRNAKLGQLKEARKEYLLKKLKDELASIGSQYPSLSPMAKSLACIDYAGPEIGYEMTEDQGKIKECRKNKDFVKWTKLFKQFKLESYKAVKKTREKVKAIAN